MSFALLHHKKDAQKQLSWSVLWPQKERHCNRWRSLLPKTLTGTECVTRPRSKVTPTAAMLREGYKKTCRWRTKPVPITKRSRRAGPTILFLNRFQPLVRNEPYNGERNLSKQKHREILIRLPFHPRKSSNHYPSNLDLKFID